MVIFLYGPDTYRLKQNVDLIIGSYRKKHSSGFNLFKFDLGSDSVEKYEEAIKSASFFEEVKLIVLKNTFTQKINANKIIEVIKTHDLLKEKNIVALFVENEPEKELASKDKNLLKLLLDKENIVRNFEFLQREKLVNFVQTEFASRNCSADPVAIASLIALVGNDSWALVNEINKLCNFKPASRITSAEVALLSFKKENLNIFDLVDSIVSKNKSRAYELMYREIRDGRDPYYLLSMIAYGFRNMLTIKDLVDRSLSAEAIAKKAKLHPFVVKKTYQNAKRFDAKELRSTYAKILDIDTKAKEGGADLTDSLYSLLLQ